MSSLALMRFLEAAPERYDRGMRWLTLGRLAALHDAVAEAAVPEPDAGGRVLEIGCGTGAVTARLASRGAAVTALDQNPEMLAQARRRLAAEGRAVEWLERTASEIDALPRHAFDAVVASLSLSEMSRDERRFVLARARERLRPGGVLVVGDEVWPEGAAARAVYRLLRAPQALVGWLAVGSVSQPVRALRGEIEEAGFAVRGDTSWLAGSLRCVVAERPS